MHADLLIHASWIAPVDGQDTILTDHSLAIAGGRIAALLPTAEVADRFTADQEQDLPGHLLIPGLINVHTHSPMTLMRGLADDLPLMVWLTKHIWPAEQRWADADFVLEGTRLALLEMLRGGITCFNDMYFYPEVTARAAADAGMRAVVGMILVDFPTEYAQDADEYIAIDAGINVALRYDGAASNNDLNLLGEMRTAALLAQGVAASASAVPAYTALRMATLNGARALGIDNEVGSITVGKRADLAAVDLSDGHTQPIYNPVSQLVYAAGRHQVRQVWVDGRQVIRDGAPCTLDAAAIIADAKVWARRIAGTEG